MFIVSITVHLWGPKRGVKSCGILFIYLFKKEIAIFFCYPNIIFSFCLPRNARVVSEKLYSIDVILTKMYFIAFWKHRNLQIAYKIFYNVILFVYSYNPICLFVYSYLFIHMVLFVYSFNPICLLIKSYLFICLFIIIELFFNNI